MYGRGCLIRIQNNTGNFLGPHSRVFLGSLELQRLKRALLAVLNGQDFLSRGQEPAMNVLFLDVVSDKRDSFLLGSITTKKPHPPNFAPVLRT